MSDFDLKTEFSNVAYNANSTGGAFILYKNRAWAEYQDAFNIENKFGDVQHMKTHIQVGLPILGQF